MQMVMKALAEDLCLKIRLSWRYGKVIYMVSAVFDIAMAVLVVFRPYAITPCIAIKAMSIPVIYYLNSTFTKGMGMYFWLNLGVSRREYRFLPFVLDFVLFLLLMVISGVIGYAIR